MGITTQKSLQSLLILFTIPLVGLLFHQLQPSAQLSQPTPRIYTLDELKFFKQRYTQRGVYPLVHNTEFYKELYDSPLTCQANIDSIIDEIKPEGYPMHHWITDGNDYIIVLWLPDALMQLTCTQTSGGFLKTTARNAWR